MSNLTENQKIGIAVGVTATAAGAFYVASGKQINIPAGTLIGIGIGAGLLYALKVSADKGLAIVSKTADWVGNRVDNAVDEIVDGYKTTVEETGGVFNMFITSGLPLLYAYYSFEKAVTISSPEFAFYMRVIAGAGSMVAMVAMNLVRAYGNVRARDVTGSEIMPIIDTNLQLILNASRNKKEALIYTFLYMCKDKKIIVADDEITVFDTTDGLKVFMKMVIIGNDVMLGWFNNTINQWIKMVDSSDDDFNRRSLGGINMILADLGTTITNTLNERTTELAERTAKNIKTDYTEIRY